MSKMSERARQNHENRPCTNCQRPINQCDWSPCDSGYTEYISGRAAAIQEMDKYMPEGSSTDYTENYMDRKAGRVNNPSMGPKWIKGMRVMHNRQGPATIDRVTATAVEYTTQEGDPRFVYAYEADQYLTPIMANEPGGRAMAIQEQEALRGAWNKALTTIPTWLKEGQRVKYIGDNEKGTIGTIDAGAETFQVVWDSSGKGFYEFAQLVPTHPPWLEPIEGMAEAAEPVASGGCECGGAAARTTHSDWCPVYSDYFKS